MSLLEIKGISNLKHKESTGFSDIHKQLSEDFNRVHCLHQKWVMNDEKIKKVRWDPIIAKLADNKLKQKICADASNHDMTSTIQEKWVAAVEKRRSKEDFQTFIHELFDVTKSKSIFPKHKKSELLSKEIQNKIKLIEKAFR